MLRGKNGSARRGRKEDLVQSTKGATESDVARERDRTVCDDAPFGKRSFWSLLLSFARSPSSACCVQRVLLVRSRELGECNEPF